MGIDYYNRSIFGVRIPWDKLFRREKYDIPKQSDKLPSKHATCPPFDTNPQMNVCPYCGCYLREKGSRAIAMIPEVIKEPIAFDIPKFKEWDISSVEGSYGENKGFYFIGFYLVDENVERAPSHKGVKTEIDTDEIETKKKRLKKDLGECGLWDEDNFGLWSFTYVSC